MGLKNTIFELTADQNLLVTRATGKRAKEAICRKLDRLEKNSVLVVDFSSIKFIDASCADEIVVRVMARLEAGEFPDRFILFKNLARQHIENINLALTVANKMVITYSGRKWQILGTVVEGHRRTLLKIVELKQTTARELQEAMGYRTINEASTKLSDLYKWSLVAREPFRQSVPGGGRQFTYISLLRDIKR